MKCCVPTFLISLSLLAGGLSAQEITASGPATGLPAVGTPNRTELVVEPSYRRQLQNWQARRQLPILRRKTDILLGFLLFDENLRIFKYF